MRKQEQESVISSRFAILFFLVFALLEGSFFIDAKGALTLPDPNIHAYSSYALATGQILNKPERQRDEFGNTIKIQPITGDSRFLDLTGYRNSLVASIISDSSSYDPNVGLQRSADQSATGKTITVASGTHRNRSNQYFPAIYLPQAIGIWVGLHTHQPPYRTWQYGRLSNLLVYMLLFCLSIAVMPKGKMFLAVIGIIPPGMFIASSLMADSLFISLSALFIALFLAITTRQGQASRKGMITLSILAVLLFMCKIIYASLAILILALPKRILLTKRKALYLGISAGLSLCIYCVWSVVYGTALAQASVSTNLEFILRHPFRMVLSIFWNFMQEPRKLLGLGAPALEFVIILGLSWGLLFHNSHPTTRKIGSSREFISRYRYQLISLLAFAILTFLIYASLLLTWNNLPTMGIADQIQGMQARYFEPFLPLLACTGFHPSEDTKIEDCEETAVGSTSD